MRGPEKPEHHCKGGGRVYVIGKNKHPASTGRCAHYGCTGCNWKSTGADFEHTPSKRQIMPKPKPRKKQKPVLDSPELRAAVNAEVRKRMARLTVERAKFPPTFLKKGKKLVNNPKFTDAMRDHMHKFYVDATEIRDELKAKGV